MSDEKNSNNFNLGDLEDSFICYTSLRVLEGLQASVLAKIGNYNQIPIFKFCGELIKKEPGSKDFILLAAAAQCGLRYINVLESKLTPPVTYVLVFFAALSNIKDEGIRQELLKPFNEKLADREDYRYWKLSSDPNFFMRDHARRLMPRIEICCPKVHAKLLSNNPPDFDFERYGWSEAEERWSLRPEEKSKQGASGLFEPYSQVLGSLASPCEDEKQQLQLKSDALRAVMRPGVVPLHFCEDLAQLEPGKIEAVWLAKMAVDGFNANLPHSSRYLFVFLDALSDLTNKDLHNKLVQQLSQKRLSELSLGPYTNWQLPTLFMKQRLEKLRTEYCPKAIYYLRKNNQLGEIPPSPLPAAVGAALMSYSSSASFSASSVVLPPSSSSAIVGSQVLSGGGGPLPMAGEEVLSPPDHPDTSRYEALPNPFCFYSDEKQRRDMEKMILEVWREPDPALDKLVERRPQGFRDALLLLKAANARFSIGLEPPLACLLIFFDALSIVVREEEGCYEMAQALSQHRLTELYEGPPTGWVLPTTFAKEQAIRLMPLIGKCHLEVANHLIRNNIERPDASLLYRHMGQSGPLFSSHQPALLSSASVGAGPTNSSSAPPSSSASSSSLSSASGPVSSSILAGSQAMSEGQSVVAEGETRSDIVLVGLS